MISSAHAQYNFEQNPSLVIIIIDEVLQQISYWKYIKANQSELIKTGNMGT